MNWLILFATVSVEKVNDRKHRLRILAGSIVGSSVELLLLLIVKNYAWFMVVCQLFLFPTMVYFGLKPRKVRFWIRECVICEVCVIVLYGITTAVQNTFQISELPFLLILILEISMILFLRYLVAHVWGRKKMVPVVLNHGMRTCRILAIVDTGNLLKEPLHGNPVHIVDPNVLKELEIPEGNIESLIPYQSLGKNGMIPIYQIDEILIKEGNQVQKLAPGILGKANPSLMKKKEYQMILNEEVERI